MLPILLATLATPITWQDIDFKQKLILNEPIALSEKLVLPAGTSTTVADILPLDDIRVLMFKMKITPCKGSLKNQTSDMIIVNELYGAKLEKNCELEIFSEFTDLSKPSLFSVK